MTNKITKCLTIISIILFSLTSFSCKKNNQATSSDSEINEPKRPQWQPTAKKICVVFGYGYNSEDFVEAEIAHLEDYYGLSDGTENSGMIIPYVYPDDFKVGNTGRISQLVNFLEDVNVAGLITIGAPEYTSNTLSLLRENMITENSDNDITSKDSTKGVKPYPIYTFFPQDDILAIEATSDFVLDRAVDQSDKVSDMEKEEDENVSHELSRISDIEKIIDNAIDYMVITKEPLKSDSKLAEHVKKIAGKNHSIKRYIDPETGLSSINHFILEDARKQ